MRNAAIFDMDGVLIDSERLWWQAGADALRTVGVDLEVSRLYETMGLRTDAALAHWFQLFPWTGKSMQEIEWEVTFRVIELIKEHAEPLPGVYDTIQLLSEHGIPIGLCSSSPHLVIGAVLKALGLESQIRVACSAEDELLGKPHPAAYLTCARQIGIDPQRCIAFEDSLRGTIAAKAAEMKVVAIPSGSDRESTKFDFCDLRLRSLTEFDESLLCQLLN
jgi:mannitol-1-/sugar-/sorbitol-6-/2-deoxyglucose-6-phosphatase